MLGGLAAVAMVVVLGLIWQVRASLPQLDGDRALPGLEAGVDVARDALGVPTIGGASRTDVNRALGFLHAQDRFFQMDLARRQAAGELSEIIGPAALPIDRRNRVHRFRSIAGEALARLDASQMALLQAYVDGVNSGLAALGSRPFEYWALRTAPTPWRPEDSLLVIYSMYFALHDDRGAFESDRGLMRDLLPAELYAFLTAPGSEWDTPLQGAATLTPHIPGPQVIDLRRAGTRAHPPPASADDGALHTGSNNWAVSGARSTTGSGIVANDMHLELRVPHIWYRARLMWTAEDGPHEVTGVTLPGVPGVIVGSNTRVAWGFTNTEGDWIDLVELEQDGQDAETYVTPEGPRRIQHFSEPIAVKGGNAEALDVQWTVWGPIVDRDHRGARRVLHWVAHEPDAANLVLLDMDGARSVGDALDLAPRAGMPEQNLMVADRDGHIGWTISGRIPRRVGFDGRAPASWADGTRRWDGWLRPDEYPRLVDPPDGALWTANNRTVDGPELAKIGVGRYDVGARARIIRDDLASSSRFDERALLAIQLDDRALFLERWRGVLLDTLDAAAVDASPVHRDVRRLVSESWSGRAAIDSVGYRLVKAFRTRVAERVLGRLTDACRQADNRFAPLFASNYEGPLWAIVRERPAHLLPPDAHDWRDELLAAADEVAAALAAEGRSLETHTWGERNRLTMKHPLSRAVPLLASWLDMPGDPLPGDTNMPRVQTPTNGASERMVVSPGHEASGVFHMPGGQSGHPLSPFYRTGHAAWVTGESTPFLPGPAVHTLRLVPTPRDVGR